jgi:hypothetical protein
VDLTMEITSETFRLAHEYKARSTTPREVMPRTGQQRQRCTTCRSYLWFEGVAWDGRYCSVYCVDPSRAEELWAALDAVFRWEALHLCECRSAARRKKIKYDTYEQAVDAMQRAQPTADKPLRVYPCPKHEGAWHLTSRPA